MSNYMFILVKPRKERILNVYILYYIYIGYVHLQHSQHSPRNAVPTPYILYFPGHSTGFPVSEMDNRGANVVRNFFLSYFDF